MALKTRMPATLHERSYDYSYYKYSAFTNQIRVLVMLTYRRNSIYINVGTDLRV